MKRLKLEDFLAISALAGVLLLFGSFLFGGANKLLTLLAAMTACGGMLLAALWHRVKPTVFLRSTSALVLCLVLMGNVALLSDAAFKSDLANFNVGQFAVTASASGNTASNSSVTGNGSVITVTARGYDTTNDCNETVNNTDTITVTVKNSSVAAVQYDLALSNVSGASTGTGLILESGASLTMTVTSGNGASATAVIGTITFSNVKSVTTGAEETTGFEVRVGGTLRIDGTVITENTSLTNVSDHVYDLVAAPGDGYSFYGWMSRNGGRISADASYSYTATEGGNDIIWPLFIKSDSAVYYIKDASPVIYYGFFDDAITAAGSSGTIVLYQSGSMYGSDNTVDFTLSGQTLLVPYIASDLTVYTSTSTVEGGWNSTLEYANTTLVSGHTHGNSAVANILLPDKEVTYTLTIPSGTTVNVASGGKFIIGGTIASGHALTAGIVCATAGTHSNVQLDGAINVSGILSSCGYVLGSGTMNVAKGGTVYQPFTLMDHRDGHYAVISNNDKCFPFNRFSMQNIQSKIHMVSGAVMKGYFDIYTQTTSASFITVKERHNVSCAPIIAASGAVINLTSGTLDISYDPNRYANDTAHNSIGLYNREGTTILNFSGEASLGAVALTINVAGVDYDLDSSTDYFPVPYNYIINLNSGTFTVDKNMKLLPGSVMNVASDAALNVKANLAVMDGFRDHGARASSADANTWSVYHYPSSAVLQVAPISGTGAANLIVDGTMNISGTFGGVVQTNGTGTVSMNGTNTLELKVGSPSANKIMAIMDTAVCGRTVRTLNAQLFTASGERITMEAGKTYVGVDDSTNTIEDYTYTLYNSSSNTSSTTTLTATLNAKLTGTWKERQAAKLMNGLNLVGGPYAYLADAAAAWQSGYSIQMMDNVSDETVKFSDGTYINLNGYSVSGAVSAEGTVYGFDSTSDGYDAPKGSLELTSGTVAPHATVDNKHYLSIAEGSAYTFHRVAVTVTGVQFLKDAAKNEYIIFRGEYKGAPDPVLTGVGFGFDNSSTKAEVDGVTKTFEFGFGTSDTTITSVAPQMMFNSVTVTGTIKNAVDNILTSDTSDVLTFPQVFDNFETLLQAIN